MIDLISLKECIKWGETTTSREISRLDEFEATVDIVRIAAEPGADEGVEAPNVEFGVKGVSGGIATGVLIPPKAPHPPPPRPPKRILLRASSIFHDETSGIVGDGVVPLGHPLVAIVDPHSETASFARPYELDIVCCLSISSWIVLCGDLEICEEIIDCDRQGQK